MRGAALTVLNPIGIERPAAVYRFYDEAGTLLYVGSAYDPDERWKEHRKKPWARDVARRDDLWYANRDAAYAAETAAIRDELPKHNITNNPAAVVPVRSGSPVRSVFEKAIEEIESMDGDAEAAVAASRLLDSWASLPTQLRALRKTRVGKLRSTGQTWEQIGSALGMTPQRAQQIAVGISGAQRRKRAEG